jgi:hypothetical protein
VRRIPLWACLGLAGATVLFLPGVGAERARAPGAGQSAGGPVPVAVSNFPTIQPVSGTVSVGNLTIDAGGRLLVALQGGGTAPLVLRSTTVAYQGDLGGRTGATRKCQAEFLNSHFPNVGEIKNAYGTRGVIWLSSDNDRSWVDDLDLSKNCSDNTPAKDWQMIVHPDGTRIDGNLVREKGTGLFSPGPCSEFHPILCAE